MKCPKCRRTMCKSDRPWWWCNYCKRWVWSEDIKQNQKTAEIMEYQAQLRLLSRLKRWVEKQSIITKGEGRKKEHLWFPDKNDGGELWRWITTQHTKLKKEVVK